MCLAAKKDADARKQRAADRAAASAAALTALAKSAPAQGEDDDGELGLDLLELDMGGTRGVTRSPQHHKLQMDNFVPDEADDDDDNNGSPTSSAGDSWVDVGKESPPPPAAACVDPASGCLAADAAAAAAPLTPTRPTDDPASANAPAPAENTLPEGEEAVEPFSLDSSFDYEVCAPHLRPTHQLGATTSCQSVRIVTVAP